MLDRFYGFGLDAPSFDAECFSALAFPKKKLYVNEFC